jgi:Methyltransferase domain
MDRSALWTYLRNGKKNVKGWLQRIDAEIFGQILDFQANHEITGGCCEIGVHRGKSFIPLCLSLAGSELALCIDVFENQDKNLDLSGRGDQDRLVENLRKHGVDLNRVRMLKSSSEVLMAQDIVREIGQVRFFSIDGGHWKSIVHHDLTLAEKTLVDGGVIALDDYCRADWPDVTSAFLVWLETSASDIIPFAIGSNKLYLCHRAYSDAYRSALVTDFLKPFYRKTYASSDYDVDTYRTEIFDQDEGPIINHAINMLRIFLPETFAFLKKCYLKATVGQMRSPRLAGRGERNTTGDGP